MSETVANAPISPPAEGKKQSVAPARSVVSVPVLDQAAATVLTIRVYYQGPDGGIFELKWGNNRWNESSSPLWYAMPCTPLAAITWDSGKQTRVYYLDCDHKLQEYSQLPDGGWKIGAIGEMNVQVAPNASIAAVRTEAFGAVRLRVYCQEAGSENIQEFSFGDNGSGWVRGAKLVSSAPSSTGIAATLAES